MRKYFVYNHTNKIKNIVAAGIFCLFILMAHYGVLTSESMSVRGDGLGYYAADCFWVTSVKNGELPLWDSFSAIGTPFLADVQTSSCYPLKIVYLFFDPVLAFNLLRIIHLFIAGFFMYLLIKQITGIYCAGIAVGLSYCFSVMLGGARVEHPTIIVTIAYYPVIIYFLEKFKNSKNNKWLVMSAVFMAVQFTGGFTQICLYFDIFLFFYIIYIMRTLGYSLKGTIIECTKWIVTYLLLISVQLVPLAVLVMQSGRNVVSYEFFKALSYDLRILGIMFFPYLYTNYYEPFENTSGIDIEIYVSIICMIYIIYLLRYHIKDKYVRFLSLAASMAFIFGMSPNIPVLGKIIYQIPLLNSFRVCARSLSIFIFCIFILFGIALSKVWNYEENKKFIKINKLLILIITVMTGITASIFSQELFVENQAYTHGVVRSMLIAVGFSTINLVIFSVITWKPTKIGYYVAYTAVICLVLTDVTRFSIQTKERNRNVQELLDKGISMELETMLAENEEYRSVALLDDFLSSGTNILNIAKAERSRYYEQMWYNNYLTFYDQKVGYWQLSPTLSDRINTNNDLLSMLGIRYILDSEDHEIHLDAGRTSEKQNIVLKDTVVLPERNDIAVTADILNGLKENTSYKISFKLEKGMLPELFYVDFYNDQYDNPEQNAMFIERMEESNYYEAQISTDKLPEKMPVYFRIVAGKGEELILKEFAIVELEKNLTYTVDTSLDPNITVYENENACPILYIPNKVYSVDSYGNNWIESGMRDVDVNNYIVDFGKNMDLALVTSDLSEIKMNRNSVEAKVITDKETFVNFSMLSYPGWKAYVDGKRVECYTVNNLIQGMCVPAGEHEIRFVFDPIDVKIGFVLTLIGVLGIVYKLFRKNS